MVLARPQFVLDFLGTRVLHCAQRSAPARQCVKVILRTTGKTLRKWSRHVARQDHYGAYKNGPEVLEVIIYDISPPFIGNLWLSFRPHSFCLPTTVPRFFFQRIILTDGTPTVNRGGI